MLVFKNQTKNTIFGTKTYSGAQDLYDSPL